MVCESVFNYAAWAPSLRKPSCIEVSGAYGPGYTLAVRISGSQTSRATVEPGPGEHVSQTHTRPRCTQAPSTESYVHRGPGCARNPGYNSDPSTPRGVGVGVAWVFPRPAKGLSKNRVDICESLRLAKRETQDLGSYTPNLIWKSEGGDKRIHCKVDGLSPSTRSTKTPLAANSRNAKTRLSAAR